MALIKCKECGKDVSSTAAACPSCGKPIPKQSQLGTGCLIVIIFFVVLAVIGQCSDKASKPASAPAPVGPAPGQSSPASTAPAPPIAIDLKNAKALDAKYGIAAGIQCGSNADDYLRSVAKYQFRWDDLGTFDFKFDRFLKDVSAPGVLTEISNKVALQNGFGAYERIQLYCEYDTQSEKTLAYSINTPPDHPPSDSEPPTPVTTIAPDNPASISDAAPAPETTQPVAVHAAPMKISSVAPTEEAALSKASVQAEQTPAIRPHGEPFMIRGVNRRCNDITQLDRALSTQYEPYFDGWTRADYDEAIIWSSTCAQYGWQSIANSRVSLLQVRETSALTR